MARIPVLLSLPTQPALVDSSRAFIEKAQPHRPIAGLPLPRGVELDLLFAAVPIGTGERDTKRIDLIPEASRRFLVRATMDVESMAAVPATIGEGYPVYADPVIVGHQPTGATCFTSPARGTHVDVQTALKHGALTARGLDGTGVAIALLDSGIDAAYLSAKVGRDPIDAANSWTPASGTPPAAWPTDHGTMTAFDSLIMAPNASLLDYPIFRDPLPRMPAISATLAAAVSAIALIYGGWSVTDGKGHLKSRYKALVVSNSWGLYHKSEDFPRGHPGRYCDNPGHAFNLQISSLVDEGADVVFSAGNCGAECPHPWCEGAIRETIMGCNAHPEVLTVGGCDVRGNRVGYSSQGPSISGMPPEKPDVMGYTHFLGAQVSGATVADKGTSAACPVVAGCIAAIRTKLSPSTTSPASLFAEIRRCAVAGPGTASGAWNADYGYGIIDPLATANALGL